MYFGPSFLYMELKRDSEYLVLHGKFSQTGPVLEASRPGILGTNITQTLFLAGPVFMGGPSNVLSRSGPHSSWSMMLNENIELQNTV